MNMIKRKNWNLLMLNFGTVIMLISAGKTFIKNKKQTKFKRRSAVICVTQCCAVQDRAECKHVNILKFKNAEYTKNNHSRTYNTFNNKSLTFTNLFLPFL